MLSQLQAPIVAFIQGITFALKQVDDETLVLFLSDFLLGNDSIYKVAQDRSWSFTRFFFTTTATITAVVVLGVQQLAQQVASH